MIPRKLRWGILGTGNIARQFAAGIAGSKYCIAEGVGSRSVESAQAFSRAHQIPRAFGSYRALITDPDIDVVYVSMPNHLHAEWGIAALNAGKHVLCEKPIALDAAQAEKMFDVAERNGRMLMEAFMYRSHPLTLAALEAVRSGVIGPLRVIRTSFCFRAKKIEGNVRFSREMGGGALMDIGCYCISFARLFAAEEPDQVSAMAHIHSTGVDDATSATMHFPGGMISSFTCATTVQADNTAYLLGEDGYIEIPVPWKPGRQSQFVIARGIPPRVDGTAAAQTPPAREIRTVHCNSELYTEEADDFTAAILESRDPRITRAESVGNMKVLDEMRRQINLSFS